MEYGVADLIMYETKLCVDILVFVLRPNDKGEDESAQ